MIETAAERIAMLSDWDSATWNATTVRGIFSSPYQDALGVVGAEISFLTDLTLVPGIATGNSMTISAIAYTVRAIEPDGTGLVRLVLEEQ